MSELGENSKVSNRLDEAVIKKISQLVTNFHSILLPKAKNSDVYRDLTQQQQYMLTTLDSENILHSILAGCLAVDSCITNIVKYQKTQSNTIMKMVSLSLNRFTFLEEEISQASSWPLKQSFTNFSQSFKKLLKNVQDYPFYPSEDIKLKKQFQNFSPQEDQGSLLTDLNIQNIKLKQKLADTQKQQVSLELKLMKMLQNSQNDEPQQLKQELDSHKQTIMRMREEKSQLIHQLQKMEEQIRILSKYSDRKTNYILEQLQYQIECLRQEKRHDERIAIDIQRKLQMMSLSRGRESNLRSQAFRSNNYVPMKQRVRRDERPYSQMKKNSLIKKSNLYQTQNERRQSIPSHTDNYEVNQSNDSFMPRYMSRQPHTNQKPNLNSQYFQENLKHNRKTAKAMQRIKTTFL